MSFKCDCCGEQQEQGTKPIRIVLKYREKTYLGEVLKRNGYVAKEEVGSGFEIAKEANACKKCAPFRAAHKPGDFSGFNSARLEPAGANGAIGNQVWSPQAVA